VNEGSRFFERAFGAVQPVRVFEEDPGLLDGLAPEARREATVRGIAPMLQLESGRCEPQVREPSGCLGLLVLDGLLIHSVRVADQPRSELIGPGDVIRPWEQEGELASVPFEADWQVVHPVRMAVLDARFVAAARRWPQVLVGIVGRTIQRSHRLCVQLAIADLRRADDRLMLFFWHLADRWGRVRPEGVVVPLPVTHDVLAQLVCTQRPTVTSALRRLSAAGALRRRPDGTWLLHPEPPPAPKRRPLGSTGTSISA
jgi:CRP/FNR family transcriptional regulator, cyclic AMP receptor protein